jgi:hypothetical protein
LCRPAIPTAAEAQKQGRSCAARISPARSWLATAHLPRDRASDFAKLTYFLAHSLAIVVGFHDVNTFTASHMTEYLHILIEEASAAGLALHDPFYSDRNEILRALQPRNHCRTKSTGQH